MKMPISKTMRSKKSSFRDGIAFPAVMTFMVVMMAVAGALLTGAHHHVRSMRSFWQSDRCLLVAQSALEDAKVDIDQTFRTFYNSPFLGGTQFRWSRLDWFDSPTDTQIGKDGYLYTFPQDQQYKDVTNSSVTISLLNTRYVDVSTREIVISCKAELGDAERTVTETVRYGLAKSRVFDYAYFINNFGWFWGSTIYANGDVRANGNFSMKYSPTVNGNMYGAVNTEIGAPGSVEGAWNFWTLVQSYANAPKRSRPGSPPASGYDEDWAMGYSGSATKYQYLDQLEMPYLGDLIEYEYLADYDDGTIMIGTNLVIDNVYTGAGPNNIMGDADDGTILLSGSRTEPIVLNGPVVARGDVIIKGYVTGQGTIYAGRNIHIASNVYYVNPPIWNKPDSNPENAATANKTNDFLGLAAKGNIIIGNYANSTWLSSVSSYIKPSFTKAYTTTESDAAIGYDSDSNPANGYLFNGDYSAYDKGRRLTGNGTNTTCRRYYESSISPSNFSAFCGAYTVVSNVDAVMYNNHLFSGHTPRGFTVNGAIVSRDEAIIFGDSVRMNWDIRVGSDSAEAIEHDFYLPRTLAEPQTRHWKEGT